MPCYVELYKGLGFSALAGLLSTLVSSVFYFFVSLLCILYTLMLVLKSVFSQTFLSPSSGRGRREGLERKRVTGEEKGESLGIFVPFPF
jgi:hypothetical protein